jgi:hypothetical protein
VVCNKYTHMTGRNPLNPLLLKKGDKHKCEMRRSYV